MTTTIERLPFTATGGHSAQLPKLKTTDPIESEGSLLLIDPTHPLTPWSSGVPADGAAIPNVLEAKALTLLGSSTPAHARPVMRKPAAFTGNAGLVERTSKGGLHAISPQGGNAVAGSGPALSFPIQIVKYLLDNPAHDMYFSIWWRLTRAATAGLHSMAGFMPAGQQTNGGLQLVAPTTGGQSPRPPAGQPGHLGSKLEPNTNALASKFSAVGWLGYTIFDNGGSNVWKTYPDVIPPVQPGYNTTIGNKYGGGINFGSTVAYPLVDTAGATTTGTPTNAGGLSGNKNGMASFAFYRCYVEDLQVSGRTFDEVATLDFQLYTKEVLTTGGRYYGDATTDPATLP